MWKRTWKTLNVEKDMENTKCGKVCGKELGKGL